MKLKLVTILLLLPSAMNTLACQNHGGFGFGAFGQFHSFAQQHVNITEPVELKVTHDSQLSVTTAKDALLQLRYIVPSEYTNAEVTLTPSKNIKIANSTSLHLSKAKGLIDVVFQATGSGEHFILVRIDATQSYRPYSKIQRVNITSI
ncbi:MAG: hypothetical protein JKY14_10800 [Paraglaciecola sp.]|nr:hypothetical protein [Paraglaciecola sp.]